MDQGINSRIRKSLDLHPRRGYIFGKPEVAVALDAPIDEPKIAEVSNISPPADSGRLVADGDDSWSRRRQIRISRKAARWEQTAPVVSVLAHPFIDALAKSVVISFSLVKKTS